MNGIGTSSAKTPRGDSVFFGFKCTTSALGAATLTANSAGLVTGASRTAEGVYRFTLARRFASVSCVIPSCSPGTAGCVALVKEVDVSGSTPFIDIYIRDTANDAYADLDSGEIHCMVIANERS